MRAIIIFVLLLSIAPAMAADPIALHYRFTGADAYILTYRLEGENTINGNSMPLLLEGRDRLEVQPLPGNKFRITAINERLVLDIIDGADAGVDPHNTGMLRRGEKQVFTIDQSGKVIDGYRDYKLLPETRMDPLEANRNYKESEPIEIPGFNNARTEAQWKLIGVKVKEGHRVARIEGRLKVWTSNRTLESSGPFHYHFDLDRGFVTRCRTRMRSQVSLKDVRVESQFFYNWDIRPVEHVTPKESEW